MAERDRTDETASVRVVVALEAAHRQPLFGFVRRLGLADEAAADAVQEVLVRLWQQLARGTRIENPRAWAYRAIYRLAMDQHRIDRRIAAMSGRLVGRGDVASDREDSDRAGRVDGGRPAAAAPAPGPLPALPGGPLVRRDRRGPRDHGGRRAKPLRHRHRAGAHTAIATGRGPVMDDDRAERALRARPPDEPLYDRPPFDPVVGAAAGQARPLDLALAPGRRPGRSRRSRRRGARGHRVPPARESFRRAPTVTPSAADALDANPSLTDAVRIAIRRTSRRFRRRVCRRASTWTSRQ